MGPCSIIEINKVPNKNEPTKMDIYHLETSDTRDQNITIIETTPSINYNYDNMKPNLPETFTYKDSYIHDFFCPMDRKFHKEQFLSITSKPD